MCREPVYALQRVDSAGQIVLTLFLPAPEKTPSELLWLYCQQQFPVCHLRILNGIIVNMENLCSVTKPDSRIDAAIEHVNGLVQDAMTPQAATLKDWRRGVAGERSTAEGGAASGTTHPPSACRMGHKATYSTIPMPQCPLTRRRIAPAYYRGVEHHEKDGLAAMPPIGVR